MVIDTEKTYTSPEQGLNSRQVEERIASGLANTAVRADSKTVTGIIRDNVFT